MQPAPLAGVEESFSVMHMPFQRLHSLAIVAPAALALTAPLATAAPPPGYELVFADEFDGRSLDTETWVHRTTSRFLDGKKLSVCTPENVRLANGNLIIDLKVDRSAEVPMTCGGVITRERFKYGYFETRVKMDAGYGWHEAFWTTASTDFNLKGDQQTYPRIEVDAFEQYATHDANTFTWGIIEWYPIRGSVARSIEHVPENLHEGFHTFGFEFTPDYMNFYFDDRMMGSVDVRHAPHNLAHIWLSAIGTHGPDGVENGQMLVDYMRIYEIDYQTDTYEQRRREMVEAFRPEMNYTSSNGTDVWIEAEHFARTGDWNARRQEADMILMGQGDRNKSASWAGRVAQTQIEIPLAGQYRLWVRSRDYAEQQPGSRWFRAAVNGQVADPKFGTHKTEGMAWEDGGVFTLPQDTVTLELIDVQRYFARVDKLLLTSDLDYVPTGLGGPEEIKHAWDDARAQTAKPIR